MGKGSEGEEVREGKGEGRGEEGRKGKREGERGRGP